MLSYDTSSLSYSRPPVNSHYGRASAIKKHGRALGILYRYRVIIPLINITVNHKKPSAPCFFPAPPRVILSEAKNLPYLSCNHSSQPQTSPLRRFLVVLLLGMTRNAQNSSSVILSEAKNLCADPLHRPPKRQKCAFCDLSSLTSPPVNN